MKCIIEKNKLADAVRIVAGVISSRPTRPILSNVLIVAEGNKARFVATDLDIAIETRVDAVTAGKTALTVPAKKLAAIADHLSTGEVELIADKHNCLAINKDSSAFKLHGLSADEFPRALAKNGAHKTFSLDQPILKRLLKLTAFSMSTDESRYVLNGALFAVKQQQLQLITTDGRRLSVATVKAQNSEGGEMVVPAKTIDQITRLLGDSGKVDVAYNEREVIFDLVSDAATIKLTSNLIEGRYPTYKQVIPTESNAKIVLPREEVYAAARGASLMTSDKSSSLLWAFTKNRLVISASAVEVGESTQPVEVKFSGDEQKIAFNADYATDVLGVVEDDNLVIELVSELSPAVFTTEDKSFLHVLMPMRRGDESVQIKPETTKGTKTDANKPQSKPAGEPVGAGAK